MDDKKRIAVVTVGRSDFSILMPLCELLQQSKRIEFGLIIGGAHFDEKSGNTSSAVEATGFPIWGRISSNKDGDLPEHVVSEISHQTMGFGRVVAELDAQIDLVIILGDRYEALASAIAFVPHNIPIAHISGGSVTYGAMDDVFRHCITKLSSLHFCELPEFSRRIIQMGEQPDRVYTVGALGLDGIRKSPKRSVESLSNHFSLQDLQAGGYALATLHTETKNPDATISMANAMVEALEDAGMSVIYTYPNADQGSEAIIDIIERAASTNSNHFVVKNLGYDWYYSAMGNAKICVGNSSSGIIEAASFGLPVVNIGNRQAGRFHGDNVIDCGYELDAIKIAIKSAQNPSFVQACSQLLNPYGDGNTAEKIVETLVSLDWKLLTEPKVFYDIV